MLQASFLLSGAALLISVYSGSMALALATIGVGGLLTVTILRARCAKCGISTFWHEGSVANMLVGVNMLQPVAARCEKCGETR